MHEASLVALAADLLESERRLVAVTSAWRRSTDAWAIVRAHPAIVPVGGSLVDDVIAALDRVPVLQPATDWQDLPFEKKGT